jgi:photosystem II stability/assembly factor-like uncharacterized protein
LGPVHAAWDQYQVLPVGSYIEGIFEMSFINPLEGWAVISPAPLRVLHTTNGGRNWTETYRNLELSSLPLEPRLHIQFVSPTEGWMTPNATWGEKKLFHSTDGGVTWPEVVHPFQSTFASVHAVWFSDPQTGWIAGEDSGLAGMIAATTDGGTNWVVRPAPYQFPARDLFFLDQQNGWVVGPGGSILFTRDGGCTWEMGRAETMADLWCVRFADPLHGWAAGSEGTILYSRDGGFRWYKQSSGTSADLYDIAVVSPDEALIAGTLDYQHGIALVTRNGGASWRRENLPDNMPFYAASAIGNEVWVGGGGNKTDSTYTSLLFHRKFQSGEYPVILVDSLPGGTTGIRYEYTFAARDGTPPYSWGFVGDPPAGMNLNGQTGLFSGVPTTATETVFEVRVTDSMGKTDERQLKLKVISEHLSFQAGTLPPATHRRTFRHPLSVSGGHQPYHWRFQGDTVPKGLSIDHQSALVGTPFDSGSSDFTLEVTDSGSLPQRVSAAFHLDVDTLTDGGWEIQHANNRITGVHFFDDNDGVSIGWSGLFYETSDGGKTWTHRNLGWMAWDFDWIGDQGWVLSSAGVGHTSNRGENWTFQNIPLSSGEKIRFVDSLHGWICGNGIAYTEDGGTSWHSADAPSGYYFGLGFRDQLHGFAGGNNFVFVTSADGGHTWQSATLPSFTPKSLIGTLSKQPGVRSADKATEIPQIKEVYFSNTLVGWIGTNVIEGYSPLLYYTSNGGQDWEKRHVGGKGTIDRFQFLSDGLHGWMGGLFSGDFYRTTDGGENWETISFGSSTHILGFHFLDDTTGWVLPNVVGLIDDTNTIQDLEGSIWKTADGGKNFHLQYGWPMEGPDVGEDFPEQYLSPGPKLLDMSFADAEHGWALGVHTFGSSALPARVLFTDSGGADWRVISTLDFGIHQICFANQLHGFALHTSHSIPVFETKDGGNSWFPRRDILQLVHGGFDSNWGDIVFADDQYGWIVFNGDYNLYEGTRILLRTTDGGNTWEKINETGRGGFHYLHFLDRKHGWMVNNFGFIEVTTNGGQTWAVQRDNTDGLVNLSSIHFADEFSGWTVGTAGNVLSTTNGGDTWIPTAGVPSASNFLDVYFATCLKGWFIGEDNALPDADTLGNPVVVETRTGHYESGAQVPLSLFNHNLRAVDSPDSVNVWALGDFGLGLKYAAPTNAIEVVTPSLSPGRVGQGYNAQLEREHGTSPFSWRVCGGALPPGLELQSNGQIVGTPTSAATFRFVAAVFDGNGESAGKKFALRIEPEQFPAILTGALPDGEVGVEYGVTLDATGTMEPYEWNVTSGELPPGLELLRYGAIGGVPTTPGVFVFEVLVADGQTPSGLAKKEVSIQINGKVVTPPGGPCDECPLFCLAMHWNDPGPVSEGDFDGDGNVDVEDALTALRSAKGE